MKKSPVLQKNPFDDSPLQSAPIILSASHFETISILRRYGTLSRSNMAELLDYSPSKVTVIVNDLLDSGLLLEANEQESTGGRRPREIRFNPDFGFIIAVNIGTTKLDIALVDFSEHIRLRRMLHIDIRKGPDHILSIIDDFLLERIEQLSIPLHKIYAYCITVPALVASDTLQISDTRLMPIWLGYRIRDQIKKTFSQVVVVVENDANAMAFGELRRGKTLDLSNFIYVKIGKSISAGIIIDGKIYHGAHGYAGDISSMYIDFQNLLTDKLETISLNQAVSGNAIANQAKLAITMHPESLLNNPQNPPTAQDVGLAAAAGDHVAQKIVQQVGHTLGKMLANLVSVFDPEYIFIGGGVSNLGQYFLAEIHRSILDRSSAHASQFLRIGIAPLGAEASMLGAIALAFDRVFVQE